MQAYRYLPVRSIRTRRKLIASLIQESSFEQKAKAVDAIDNILLDNQMELRVSQLLQGPDSNLHAHMAHKCLHYYLERIMGLERGNGRKCFFTLLLVAILSQRQSIPKMTISSF